jgi:Tfp pilus assembly protein PilF
MSKHRTRIGRRVVLLCAALLAASLSVGCASSGGGRKAEEEARLKKARSHLNLGVDYLRTDRVALAMREFQIAEKFDPRNARVQFAMGEAYLRRDKPAEAELRYRRVLELAPSYHDARLNLAALYLELGRYEECIDESALLADDVTFPGPWRALSNQGEAEYKLGQTQQARQTLGKALEYMPGYWPAMLSLAILEMETERRPEAVELFEMVLGRTPVAEVRAEVNYRLGEIYVSLGKRDRAVDYLTAAVADSPGGTWGEKSEEYLKLLR